MIPVVDGPYNNVIFHAKDKQSAARIYRQRHKDNALERAGFKLVVFESDPDIHESHYYRCNYAK